MTINELIDTKKNEIKMQMSYIDFATKEEKEDIEKKIKLLGYDIKYLSELEKYKKEATRYKEEFKAWIKMLEEVNAECDDLEVKYWYQKIIHQFRVFIREGYL